MAGRFVQVAIGPDWRAFRRNDPVGHPIRGDSYRIVGNPAAIQKRGYGKPRLGLPANRQPTGSNPFQCLLRPLCLNAAAPFSKSSFSGDRTPSAGAPSRHTDPRRTLLPTKAPSGWRPFLPACSASFASSVARSVILAAERFLHFQPRHENVLVQPEMEIGRFPLSSIPPVGRGILKVSGSTDPTRIWKPRKEQVRALPFIVSMSPPGHPSASSRPARPRSRFARQDHCGFTTSIGLN